MRIRSFKTPLGQPSSAYVVYPFYSGKNTNACIEDHLNAGINRLVIPFADQLDGADGVKEIEIVRVLQRRIDDLEQRHRLNAMCGNKGALGKDYDRLMRVMGVIRNTLHSATKHLEEMEELFHAENIDTD